MSYVATIEGYKCSEIDLPDDWKDIYVNRDPKSLKESNIWHILYKYILEHLDRNGYLKYFKHDLKSGKDLEDAIAYNALYGLPFKYDEEARIFRADGYNFYYDDIAILIFLIMLSYATKDKDFRFEVSALLDDEPPDTDDYIPGFCIERYVLETDPKKGLAKISVDEYIKNERMSSTIIIE